MRNWPKLVAAVSFLSLPLGWLAERRYRQMPHLAPSPKAQNENKPAATLPPVSIIVPARNEASNLPRLLPSLCTLQYPGRLERIVVDDNSTDETAVIAQNFGVQLVSLDGPPAGWLGKPYACHRGTAVAQGEWLLFTDADTEHTPNGLALAMQYALENQLDGLTFHLGHITNGWLDSATLLAAFAGLFVGLPRRHASLNGQYILLRRSVYERTGGFAAVRTEPLEDMALGRYLHDLGYRVPMLRGDNVARVAMYQSQGQLWRGMSRLGAGALRFAGVGSLLTGLLVTALMTPLLTVGLISIRRLPLHWAGWSWGTAVLGVWPWAARFGPVWRAFFVPLGALIVQLSALWGLLNRVAGHGIPWKGRLV